MKTLHVQQYFSSSVFAQTDTVVWETKDTAGWTDRERVEFKYLDIKDSMYNKHDEIREQTELLLHAIYKH